MFTAKLYTQIPGAVSSQASVFQLAATSLEDAIKEMRNKMIGFKNNFSLVLTNGDLKVTIKKGK